MSDPTPAADNSAQKRSHDEISDSTANHITQDPAPKRQHTGPAPSPTIDPLPTSAADAVISSSTNVLTSGPAPDSARSLPPMDEEEMMAMLSAQESGLDAARSGPSLLPSHAGKKQQQRQKQRGREKYEKSAERYKGKDSREWGSRNEEGKDAAGVGGDERAPRLPKYKCAILLGFSGSGYNGMQIQNASAAAPDAPPTATRTIEGILFEALVDVGAVASINADDPKKVDLSRAARTDAGVSAAGNVVSLKMIIKPPGVETADDLTRAINARLPDDIRVWSWTRTLQGFNARTACDTRVYEYLLPSYTLLPPRPGTHLHQQLTANALAAGLSYEEHAFWQGYDHDAALEAAAKAPLEGVQEGPEELTPARRRTLAELARKRAFRISADEVERFRELMKAYLGTHNFHNYTLAKTFKDRSCNRYMIDIDVAEPVEHNGMEWLSVKIHGQSFMLHQIRKMISMAVLAARTKTPASLIPKTFGPEQIHVPKAPALGLLLEQPRFKTYNDNMLLKSKQNNVEHNHPLEFETHKDEIFAFKLKHIYERLRRDEESAAHYHNWTTNLDNVQGTSLSYLNPQGDIPEEALRKKKSEGPKADTEQPLEGVESDDDGKPVKQEDY